MDSFARRHACRYNARLRAGQVVARSVKNGSVAQSVEQRIENPCVGGSIPPRATNKFAALGNFARLYIPDKVQFQYTG